MKSIPLAAFLIGIGSFLLAVSAFGSESYDAKVVSVENSNTNTLLFTIVFRNAGETSISLVGNKEGAVLQLWRPYFVVQERCRGEWKDVVLSIGTFREPPDNVIVSPGASINVSVAANRKIFINPGHTFRFHLCSQHHLCNYYTSAFEVDAHGHLDAVVQ